LEELPPAIGGNIALFLYGEILNNMPIFKGLGPECMTHLCRLVHPMTALKTQLITEEGKVGTELYFIVDGEVEVIQNDERLGFLGVGSFFGENPVLEAIAGRGGDDSTVRMRTVKATNQCDLGYLKLGAALVCLWLCLGVLVAAR
jgi:CRP-like cAMP-binding protein